MGMEGVEPPRLSAVDFESTTSAIPSHTRKFGSPSGLRTRNLSLIKRLLCAIELQDHSKLVAGGGFEPPRHIGTGL